jgi:hypothetical protein
VACKKNNCKASRWSSSLERVYNRVVLRVNSVCGGGGVEDGGVVISNIFRGRCQKSMVVDCLAAMTVLQWC